MEQQPKLEPELIHEQPALPNRKRRKERSTDEPSQGKERRLRRSHEACSRCRTKKIKCDSKHPKCTACTTSNSPCHQEDRHRQVLTPRGYQEHIEAQLKKCDALLKKHDPSFSIDRLDEILAAEGIYVDLTGPPLAVGFQTLSETSSAVQPTNVYPLSPAPSGYIYAPTAGHGPMFNYLQNGYPHPPVSASATATLPVPGQDPQLLDLTNETTIPRSFRFPLTAEIRNAITASANSPSAANLPEKEDIGVGVGGSGLSSGRGVLPNPEAKRNDSKKWFSVVLGRGSPASDTAAPAPHLDIHTSARLDELANEHLTLWLPKDRKMLFKIVDVYFSRLNIHRPVYTRIEFEKELERLYDESGQHASHDPGFVCGLYLVLALGTLSELNRKLSVESEKNAAAAAAQGYPPFSAPISSANLMPANWPEYSEFFHRALAIQPDLRITISSLQALILLHWYLYTERQGRSLWRLVGSLVRMAIELGLHHDPVPQTSESGEGNSFHTFTAEECRLRIRLWGIIIIHDRGTSLLLGRPLGISPSDTNTPHPPIHSSTPSPFSEHFLLSHAIAELQADIVVSLYQPGSNRTSQDIMTHARRIINKMAEFRSGLPKSYTHYFSGTDEWLIEDRMNLVLRITEDQGLTLLKLGIARILLLRAVISSPQVPLDQRFRALNDAIITSHNIIVVHHQLIRTPDIAFFTSPIPLHIAAMVILHGEMMRHTNSSPLSRQTATEDVWLALDMIPHWRWRWDRQDLRGQHPLIAHFASHILEVDLHQVRPSGNPYLLSEEDWTTEPIVKSQHSTPVLRHEGSEPLPDAPPIPHQPTNVMNLAAQHLYPFYPEQVEAGPPHDYSAAPVQQIDGQQHYLGPQQLFANNGVIQASYGCQPSESSYVNEVLDVGNNMQEHEPRGWAIQQQQQQQQQQQHIHNQIVHYPAYHQIHAAYLPPVR